MDKKLEILCSYANVGWHIFPVKPNGKAPLTKHGHNDATTNLDQIKKWHKQYPNANWAVATGKKSNLFVIDVDVKGDKKGLESWKQLKKVYGLSSTLRCNTPTGGRHYYYQWPKNSEVRCLNGLMDGIDIKGNGGYVVIPPSTINGESYDWN